MLLDWFFFFFFCFIWWSTNKIKQLCLFKKISQKEIHSVFLLTQPTLIFSSYPTFYDILVCIYGSSFSFYILFYSYYLKKNNSYFVINCFLVKILFFCFNSVFDCLLVNNIFFPFLINCLIVKTIFLTQCSIVF